MTLEDVVETIRKITPTFAMPFAEKCWRYYQILHSNTKETLKIQEIHRYYKSKRCSCEIKEVLSGIRKYGLQPFPYIWAEQPVESTIDVYFDDDKKLPFVFLDGKRLYYPREMSSEDIQRYHYSVQMVEQHPSSPHRYLTDTFDVSDKDIVADCGVAEGNFSLSVVDRVQKLYLFEPEEKWMEPLHATFSPWKDKVEIVQTYISDSIMEGSVSNTIDNYFSDKEPPTFLKLDVEGFEKRVLTGAIKSIESGKVKKIVSCAYHYADDEEILGNFLHSHGYSVTPSHGYMVFSMYDELKPPYFRRGLLRGII